MKRVRFVHAERYLSHLAILLSLDTFDRQLFELLTLLGCALSFRKRSTPLRWRRIPDTQLPLQLLDVLFPPFLPIHRDQAPRAAATLQRPRDVVPEQAGALSVREPEVPERGAKTGHGQTEVRELEELDGELVRDGDGHVGDAVVEVVAFAVALHHVCELGVVDIVDLRPE